MTSFSSKKRQRQNLIDELVDYSRGLDATMVEKIIIYAKCLFLPDCEDINETTFMSELTNQFGMTNSFMINLILNGEETTNHGDGLVNIKYNMCRNGFSEEAVVIARKTTKKTVSLEQFSKLICTFLTNNIDVKINFVFRVYDLDHDGFISRLEVSAMLKSSIPQGEDEQDELLKELIELVMKVVDLDGTGAIHLEEFRELVKKDLLYIEVLGQCLPDDKICLRFKKKLLQRNTLEVKEYFENEQANTGMAALFPVKKNNYYPIKLDM